MLAENLTKAIALAQWTRAAAGRPEERLTRIGSRAAGHEGELGPPAVRPLGGPGRLRHGGAINGSSKG